MQGLLDILELHGICSNSEKAMKEIKIYQDQLESFSHKSASLSTKGINQICAKFKIVFIYIFKFR